MTHAAPEVALNVLGTPLQICSLDPLTGFLRDGHCSIDALDGGTHVVCASVTQVFLTFTLSRGNDLITPRPQSRFSGLKPGDAWCLCVLRWKEALDAGCAPPVNLACTYARALDYVTLAQLQAHALAVAHGARR